MRWLNGLSILLLASPALPCIVFCVSDGKHAYGGNNEDYTDPRTRMWIVPGEAGQHGRVCFGFTDGFAQGGINDAGLFFDGLALDAQDVAPTEKPSLPANPGDFALARCSSVKEVLELFEHYDRGFLESGQLLFGDRSGDGAIVEAGAVIRKQGPYLVSTNFRQSETPPKTATCPRFQSAERILSMTEASVDACRKVLSATHQEGEVSTLYSNVYDLEKGRIHLYHFHEFETVVVLDVAEEIAKGAHTVEIASLFAPTFAFTNFQRDVEAAAAAAREKERDRTVDPKTFDAFAGRFRVQDGVGAGFEFRVRREKDKLFADFPRQDAVELVPRGGAAFVCITGTERADLTFERGKDDAVGSVTLVQEGVRFVAARIE